MAVGETIVKLGALYAEVYDHKANCVMRQNRGPWSCWKVQIVCESESAQHMLTQDPRFQALLTDLRATCKPTDRLRNIWHTIWHPLEFRVVDSWGPIILPEQSKRTE